MEFKKYASITRVDSKKSLEDTQNRIGEKLLDDDFVVEEKIHGANFSYYVSKDGITHGRRTSFLKNGEKFFNYHDAVDKYNENVISLRKFIIEQFSYSKNTDVVVFGELYGGYYPTVPTKKNWSTIQKGIYYRPDCSFIAFDVLIIDNDEGFGRWMNIGEKNSVFEMFEIEHCEPLFRGTLKECLEYPNDFNSTLPAILGLPTTDDPNVCEGTVIRPFNNNERFSNSERMIFKNKNEKWSERARVPKQRIIKQAVPHVVDMINILKTYITPQRLSNICTHLGIEFDYIERSDFGKLIPNYSRDILADFLVDNGVEFEKFNKSDQGAVKKQLSKLTVEFLNSIILKNSLS